MDLLTYKNNVEPNNNNNGLELQINSIYSEFGRFAITFEHVCFNLKSCIEKILVNKGLSDQFYATIILGKLTAEPIKTIFQSVVNTYFENKDDLIKLDLITNHFGKLIEIRNLVIHTYWMIFAEDVSEKTFVVGYKERLNKAGLSIYNLQFWHNDINSITDEMEQLKVLTLYLEQEIQEKNERLSLIELNDLKLIDFDKYLKGFKK